MEKQIFDDVSGSVVRLLRKLTRLHFHTLRFLSTLSIMKLKKTHMLVHCQCGPKQANEAFERPC